jgi:hypothetical protein
MRLGNHEVKGVARDFLEIFSAGATSSFPDATPVGMVPRALVRRCFGHGFWDAFRAGSVRRRRSGK